MSNRPAFRLSGVIFCRDRTRRSRVGPCVKVAFAAGTSLLALSLAAPRASAAPTYFYAVGPGGSPGSNQGPFGSIQTYTAPTTGLYDILATGAPGSNNGYGAQVGGDFTLTQGEMLEILVGKSPQSGSVVGNDIGAAGGGGAGSNGNLVGGGRASLTPDGGGGEQWQRRICWSRRH